VKGQPLAISLRNGWKLFKENWLISIEMALLLALINLALGLLAIFIVLVLAVPFLFLAAIFIKFGSVAGFWLVALSGFASFMVFLFLAGAILATFQVSAWTGLFLELINKGGTSKIVRMFGKSQ
jgi:peptidoglycan/LPS O-acetylase OafA/YrhL